MTASDKYSKLMKVLARMAPPLPSKLLDKEFTPEEMIADLHFMLRTMEEVHPDLYFTMSQQKVNSLLKEAELKIRSGINRAEFYEITAFLVAGIADDHTAIELPTERYQKNAETNGPVFPFEVSIENGRIAVKSSFSTNLDGVEVLSINGVDSSEILERILRTISGLTLENRESRAGVSFRQYFFLFYGAASEFNLEVMRDGKSEVHTIPAVTSGYIVKQKQFETSSSPSEYTPYEYRINREKNYALLSFRQCVDHSSFASLSKKMFTEIKETGVENLIVDLQGNSGGQSSLANDLCSYLTDKPINHFARIDVKVSRQIRKYYSAICRHLASFPMSLLPARFIHGEPWRKGVGEIVSVFSEQVIPEQSELQFTGNVFALTDSFTASSASDLAVILKDNGLGKTVGKNTGGFATSYGDSYLFSLPNTFLQCRVSHKFFVRPNGSEIPGPVSPDYPVDTDALSYTVALLKT